MDYMDTSLLELGATHLGVDERALNAMSSEERKNMARAAHVSFVDLCRCGSLDEFESMLSPETHHLITRYCGIHLPRRYKMAFDVQGEYYEHREFRRRDFSQLDDISKKHGFSGGVTEFIDTFSRCQLAIALTFGMKDYWPGGYGPFPDLSPRGLLRQNEAIIRHRCKEYDDIVAPNAVSVNIDGTETIDLVKYYTSMDAFHILLLGWLF